MILFSSFTHIYVFMLFLYLGLCSGLIFFIASIVFAKLLKPRTNTINKKTNGITGEDNSKNSNATLSEDNNLKVENVNVINNSSNTVKTKKIFSFFKLKRLNKSNKNVKEKSQKQNSKKIKHAPNKNQNNIAFKKLKSKFCLYVKSVQVSLNKFKQPILKVLFTAINIMLVFSLFIACYLINLKFNYGEVRTIYVLIFVIGVVLSKSLLNLLANFISNFYNCFRGKFKKN